MSLLLTLPLLLPLVLAALSLLLPPRAWLRRGLALVGTAALTALAALLLREVWRGGVLAVQVAGWEAPLGITLVADLLGALRVLLTGVMGLAVVVYSAGTLPE
jgi:multicomponent Na+:H+ antiporter subunit D